MSYPFVIAVVPIIVIVLSVLVQFGTAKVDLVCFEYQPQKVDHTVTNKILCV